MKGRIPLNVHLTPLLLAVVAIGALNGPTMMGVVDLKASGAEVGVRSLSVKRSTVIQEYRIGDVKVIGAKLLPPAVIQLTLGLTRGEIYNEAQLRKGFDELKKIYRKAAQNG